METYVHGIVNLLKYMLMAEMNTDKRYLSWVDGLKAFAIIAILLNHFVESFGSVHGFLIHHITGLNLVQG